MPDRESVITHLQIIHTWAEFARERDLQFFTAKHLEDIAQWADDALELLNEQKNDLRIMFNRCKATAKLLTSGGACKQCGMREKCGAGD